MLAAVVQVTASLICVLVHLFATEKDTNAHEIDEYHKDTTKVDIQNVNDYWF